MKSIILVVALLITLQGMLCHIPVIEKAAIRTRYSDNRPIDKFSFQYPYDLDKQTKTQNNSFADARAVHFFMEDDEAKVIKFTVKEGEVGIANTVPWVPACRQHENIYVSSALLGPLSDPRFQPIPRDIKREYNIKWELPAGYGAVLGLNTRVPRGEERPTINITRPIGEFANKWFMPYNSGELDPEAIAFRTSMGDLSLGKAGCTFPPERCPGAPYNTTTLCPHFKVGNFCGPKPWRWINERDLAPATYYYVYWENNGKTTDAAVLLGWAENFKMGVDANGNACGSQNTLDLPPGCKPVHPELRARIPIFWDLLTDGATLHKKCDWVDY